MAAPLAECQGCANGRVGWCALDWEVRTRANGDRSPGGCWCPCPGDAQRDHLPHACPAVEAEGRTGMRPSLPAPVSRCAGDNSQGRGFALPAPGVPGHPGV